MSHEHVPTVQPSFALIVDQTILSAQRRRARATRPFLADTTRLRRAGLQNVYPCREIGQTDGL